MARVMGRKQPSATVSNRNAILATGLAKIGLRVWSLVSETNGDGEGNAKEEEEEGNDIATMLCLAHPSSQRNLHTTLSSQCVPQLDVCLG